MKRFSTILFWLVFLGMFSSSFGVTTGKITGVVTSAETNEPLVGVNIFIPQLGLGGTTDDVGRYFILNVPVGTYELRASYIGYKESTVSGVRVTIDNTTWINIELEQTVLEGEGVTVYADKPMIKMDNTSTSTEITADDIVSQPSESFTQLIALEAGAVGSNIRGGRASGTAYFIDGLSIKNPFTGYGGQATNFEGGSTTGGDNPQGVGRGPATAVNMNVELPEFAFNEVEMMTGGYSPEYGNAQDAVVNIATIEGREKHTGRFRVTDEGNLFSGFQSVDTINWYIDKELLLASDYYMGDSLVSKGGYLIINGNKYYQEDIDKLKKTSNTGYYKGKEVFVDGAPIRTETRGNYQARKYSFALSGPLFGKLKYSFAGEFLDQERGLYENHWVDNYSYLGKLTYKLSNTTKLNLSLLQSYQKLGFYAFNQSKYDGGYIPGFGIIPASYEMTPDRIKNTTVFSGVLNHTINDHSYLTLTVGNFRSSHEQKQRDATDYDGDGDTDEYLVFKKIKVKSGHPDSTSGAYAYQEELEWRYTTEDNAFSYIWTLNPSKSDSVNYPGTYDPNYAGEWKIGNEELLANNHVWTEDSPVGWRNIWIPQYDDNTGEWTWRSEYRFVNGYNEMEEEGSHHSTYDEQILNIPDAYWQVTGENFNSDDFSSSINTFKLDYSNQLNNIHFIQVGGEYLKYDLDILTISAFGISNFYVDQWKRQPSEYSLYFRDKIEMGGLIVNAGLRLEGINLGDNVVYSNVALDPTIAPVDQETQTVIDPVTWDNASQIYISPRLGISHPITTRDMLHFSYNHFIQRPEWRYYYENLDYDIQGAFIQIGNPELKPQKTIAYEVGFTHQFTENTKLDVTAFYKDIFNWVQQVSGGNIPGSEFWPYANADFGNVKGLELAFDKRMSNNFSMDINYTYMISSGRLSSVALGGTYLWRSLVAPRHVYPLDYDQRHTIAAKFAYRTPLSTNLLTGGWNVNMTNRFGSGLPYDSESRAVANVLPAENDKRLPFTNITDLRIEKMFKVGTFGFAAFTEVFNLFDRKNLSVDPFNPEWYQSKEDLDGNGVEDHYKDPEGRKNDWTVWDPPRRIKIGIELKW